MLWKDTKQTAVNSHAESHLASCLRTAGAEREHWRTYACGSCLWTWRLRRLRDSETPHQLLRSTCRSLPRQCGSSADSGERRTARTNHNTTQTAQPMSSLWKVMWSNRKSACTSHVQRLPTRVINHLIINFYPPATGLLWQCLPLWHGMVNPSCGQNVHCGSLNCCHSDCCNHGLPSLPKKINTYTCACVRVSVYI